MKIKLDTGAYMPKRGHKEDAGLDIMTPYGFVLRAHSSQKIDTGVHVQIPIGYFGKLESKSGLNVNHSIVSLGGIIDSGFTGSIVAKIYNFSDEDYRFNQGDKIIQMIIQPCLYQDLEIVDELDKAERGNSGFGSTGR